MPATRITLLKTALAMLASPVSDQLAYLDYLQAESHVQILALEFQDLAAATEDMRSENELTLLQFQSLKNLESQLQRMSPQSHPHLYTPEALSNSSEWAHLRLQARHCLQLFTTGS